MARWKHEPDLFPAPLREFVESEWPPVEGECLTHYGCHGQGYGMDCVPREGEPCGQRHYESLTRDYPDRPELLERALAADRYTRFHQARLAWVEGDEVAWMEEFLSSRYHEIRYGRPRP
jgi:hypothetical protein